MGRVHDIMLMVDLGDLREGIWPNDLLPTVEEVLKMKGVRIAGIGTNLGCFGAIMPTEENLGQLVAHAYKIERLAGISLDWVSGGASSTLPLLLDGTLPSGINNLRVGEAILQGGLETFRDTPWDELELDACRLSGELIEVKLKPSRPIGQSGYDAFGNQPVFVDEGDRLRAIANIGREDVLIEGLTPIHKGVRVLGGSSDHLLLDVTDADPPVAVGNRVSFRMNYGAMLSVMTSGICRENPHARCRDDAAGEDGADRRRSPGSHGAGQAGRRRAAGGDELRCRRARRHRPPAIGAVAAFGGRRPADRALRLSARRSRRRTRSA